MIVVKNWGKNQKGGQHNIKNTRKYRLVKFHLFITSGASRKLREKFFGKNIFFLKWQIFYTSGLKLQ